MVRSPDIEFLSCGVEVMPLLLEEILCAGTVSMIITCGTNLFMPSFLICNTNLLFELDPRLTARHGGGHMPLRIVMTQTLNLPEEANLWDISDVSTIVATQRGARRSFQKLLASKGVEVVEFDILNPREVMEYFYDRGYLSILWECGGALAASAISSGVIHKVYLFYF